MNLTTAVLGSAAVKKLTDTQHSAVLQIGSDRLTRGDLARVECYNFHAARLLTNLLAALKVPNLRHVYDDIAPQDLVLPGMGVISLAVLGAAFEAKGIGGETPLENYMRVHAARTNGSSKQRVQLVTFDTMKRRAHAEEQRLKREARRKRRGA